MNLQIFMNINSQLAEALRRNNIEQSDYMPAYGGESVGLDLWNASSESLVVQPISTSSYVHDANWFDLPLDVRFNKSKTLIPTGLRLALPLGTVAIVKERGSVSKTPLIARAGVIDPGYTNEIWVNCVNVSSHPFTIHPYEKLPFQIVVTPALNNFNAVAEEDFISITQDALRQHGQIGSSD